ncbi:hypothetical protein FIV42_13490 [Persicimonas caeni]|uniref:Uncharacterized protein n=1 Tax=Persicimonas caeni TaxID=2292766 RepID=A0A4Y6PU08_PERCE|nr:hypothetical protein [Persicimonas caeni]QDG51723.1 hypothetical protein FIV42_13490 [Persicimonas caeni]QED32944.1 hypothetical protein FRD00_13485 [Persicimonas caeni]
MRQSGHSQLTGFLAQAAIVCGLVLLLWPTSAHADVGRCVEHTVSDLAEQGVASLLTMTPADAPSTPALSLYDTEEVANETPCGDDPDTDPSSNFCFEDAQGQISTLPSLLAKWRGEQAANAVIDSMFAAVEPADDEADAAPVVVAESVEVEPEPADSEGQSCRSNPDECRSLPPAPPTLTVDVSTASARQLLYELQLPPSLSEDNPRAWAQLRIGPLHGHRDPPEEPPRA